MFVWVRFSHRKELINSNCTGYVLLDHVLHQYDDEELLPTNDDSNWPKTIAQFDLADENGYVLQLNRYLGEMASTVLVERETYVLLKMTVGDDGRAVYTPLIEQEDEETPFIVKDVPKPRGVGIRPKKPTVKPVTEKKMTDAPSRREAGTPGAEGSTSAR